MIFRYKAFIALVLPVVLSHCGEQEVQKSGFMTGDLLYESSMATRSRMQGWRMEGPGEVTFKDGWMNMYSENETGHHVFWCPQDFTGSFIAEWEAQHAEIDSGLCIIFFAARGDNGEDIFDPGLPKRDGTFIQYTRGAIVSYHISYYANTPNDPHRKTTNLRKNNTFTLVQQGEEGIPAESEKIHKLTLIKDGAHILFYVDERKIIDWHDEGTGGMPALKDGKIGFRQMKWTHFRYRNFKVWDLVK
jgi:hypothetical protein